MATLSSDASRSRSGELPAGLVATALGPLATAVLLARYLTRPSSPNEAAEEYRRRSLVAYLKDHLSGADAAIQVVRRLRTAQEGSADARLFASLAAEFESDREVVRSIVAQLGASTQSVKRVAGHASGAILSLAAGGPSDTLSALRTLEALAIGVQGKRCMWRALQGLGSALDSPDGMSFAELETRAIRQWEAIERRRQAVAVEAFASRKEASSSAKA